MSSSKNNKQMIFDLNKILTLNDFTEINRMKNEFEVNGWCFVLLPTELIPDSTLMTLLSEFFQEDSGKERYSQHRKIYGYSKVNHKEGIKLLTGKCLQGFVIHSLVPELMIEPLNYLCQALDAATKRLIEVLDQYLVFYDRPSLRRLRQNADLPPSRQHFGMLDIVSYFNNKNGFKPPENGETTEEVNCVPHYDPGLLSISILSTLEGLQLKNMTTNEWIDGPFERNIGVIWLGEIASRITRNRLKPGIHRVIYPQEAKRRLTIWYEVCTVEQLRNLSVDKQNERMEGGTVTFENLPGSAPITVFPGEKKVDFLKRIESGWGLSMSKPRPPIYILKKHDISYPIMDMKTEN